MKMLVPHPNEQKREQKGNSQDGPDTACQPENQGLQQWIYENDEGGSHKLDLGNPPGSQDIPQQETDKGVVEYGVGVCVIPDFLLQQ